MILICLSYIIVFNSSELAESSCVTLSAVSTVAAGALRTGQAMSCGDAVSFFVFPAVYHITP